VSKWKLKKRSSVIIIQVYDYTNATAEGGVEVRVYFENQLDKVAEESGYSIADIKGHISKAHSDGGQYVVYLSQGSWRRIWDVDGPMAPPT
jgi:hypothetical protein